MWQRATSVDGAVLARCVAIGQVASPPGFWESTERCLSQLRFEVGTGAVELFYYRGGTFELAAHCQYRAKNTRYVVCYSVAGEADARLVLDLVIEHALEFGRAHGIERIYSLEPREAGSPLLRELYELSGRDPRVCKELLSEMPDQRLFRISYSELPVER